MGIEGLWNELRALCPHVFETIPMSSFRGKRIAIDAGTWMFPLRLRARKNVVMRMDIIVNDVDETEVDKAWYDIILWELYKFFECGITPIIVFDGPSPPAKKKTKDSRINQAKKREARIAILKQNIRNSKDRLRVNENEVLELRNLESQVGGVPQESKDSVRFFLKNLGIPCLIGEDKVEAERLASALVRAGIAAAVFSKDGDCLPHGAGMLIRDFDLPMDIEVDNLDGSKTVVGKEPTFEIVRLANILHSLQMTQEMFTDMCILAGCDYNKNLPGLAITGVVPKIKAYGCIERIPYNDKQKAEFARLEMETCRELFRHVPFYELFDVKIFAQGLNLTPETLTNKDAFDVYVDLTCLAESMRNAKYNVYNKHYEKLSNFYLNIPEPSNYFNLTQVFENGFVKYIGDQPLPRIVSKQPQITEIS